MASKYSSAVPLPLKVPELQISSARERITRPQFENYSAGTTADFPANQLERTGRSDREKGRKLLSFQY